MRENKKMKSKTRKPRPSPPKYFWWDQDGCWDCPDRNRCNSCKRCKEYVSIQNERKRRK